MASDSHPCPVCGTPKSIWLDDNCPTCLMRLGTPVSHDAATPDEPVAARVRLGTIRYLGDYELLEEIARGGMGAVYRARQISLNRAVAVKVLLGGHFANETFIKRFRREAEAAASLNHPNIVSIYEVGEHEGQPYFSMELIQGRSLAELTRNGPLPARRAAHLLKTIAEAIQFANERGLLHRDLKPSNVLVDSLDRPHVTDFGIVKRIEGDADLTLTGQVLGTPNYMPPEQADPKRGQTSAASDVYSLGAVFYHLLCGRAPFLSQTIQATLRQVLDQEPVSPRLLNIAVPRDLDTICLKCLEKDPARRYASARELAEELGRFLQDEPIHATPAGPLEKLWRWSRRNRALAISAATTLTLLLVIAIGSPITACRISRERRAAEVARNNEAVHRELAERERQVAQEHLYAADMFLADRSLKDSDFHRAHEALLRHLPQPGRPDMRGFEWHYSWKAASGDVLFKLEGHSNVVNSVAFSPDEKWIASASRGKGAKLWDLETRIELRSFTNADCVAFSSDGNLLITASMNDQVNVWDLRSGDLRFSFATGATPYQRNPNACLAASPVGSLFAVCTDSSFWGGRGSVRLYDLADGKLVRILTNSGDRMAFSGDGRLLATGSVNGEVKIWEAATGQLVSQFGGTGNVSAFAFSKDGRRVAWSEDFRRDVRVWDLAAGRELPRFSEHEANVWAVAFSPDGQWLASASTDQTLRLYDLERHRQAAVLRGHSSEIWSVNFSHDGHLIASGSKDEAVAVWAGRLSDRARSEVGPAIAVRALMPVISPDSRLIAASDGHSFIRVWHLPELRLSASFFGERWPLGFTADGAHLMTLNERHVITTWDLASGSVVREVPLSPERFAIASACLSPGGDLLAAWSNSRRMAFWNASSGAQAAAVTSPQRFIRGAAFSPDGRLFATAGEDGTMCLWDTTSATQKMVFLNSKGMAMWPAFSPDGKLLAGCYADNTVRIWRLADGAEVTTLKAHSAGVNMAAFSGDGRTLATGSDDNTIRLFHVPTWREVASFSHGGYIAAMLFSPDSRMLVHARGPGLVSVKRTFRTRAEERAAVWPFPGFLSAESGLTSSPAIAPGTEAEDLACAGRWKEAAADLSRAVALNPTNEPLNVTLAVVLAAAEDAVNWRVQCRHLLSVFGTTTNADVARRVVEACLLLPDTELEVPDRLLELAKSKPDDLLEAHLGLVEFRLGNGAAAVEWLKKSLARNRVDRRDVRTWFILAMAHQQLGNNADARAAFEAGEKLIAGYQASVEKGHRGSDWRDWVFAQVLMREAAL
jgi:WD40 repeat protein/serine/threonine protein kinase